MSMELALPRTQFPLYEHKVRSNLEDLISRVFSAPFAKTFSAPLGGAAAAIPWYLSGGIAAANCIAAYDAKNAASLAASYVNLAKPGTYDCTAPVAAPTQTPGTGWTFNGSNQYLKTSIVPAIDQSYSFLIEVSAGTWGDFKYICGCGSTNLDTDAFAIRVYQNKFFRLANGAYIQTLTGSGTNAGVSGNKAYIDGSALSGTITTWTIGSFAQDVYLGCINGNGSGNAHCAVTIEAFAVWNTNISSYIAALTAAMAAL